MGMSYKFRCEECDYTPIVSGGPDMGLQARFQTSYCPVCRELLDIATERWPGCLRVPGNDDSTLNKCWHCGGTDLSAWNNGDPCPRCGGCMVRGKVFMDWD